jgi:hypothetical protein
VAAFALLAHIGNIVRKKVRKKEMDNLEYWQLAINIMFSAFLLLGFGIGCIVGHYCIYRIRG